MNIFATLPDSANLWIYTANRTFSDETAQKLLANMRNFTQGWVSHGRPVEGEVMVIENRFVLLAAQILDGDLSGCGIDASVHALDSFAESNGFTWLPSLYILYRDENGEIQTLDRRSARKKAIAGEITAQTRVFDTAINELGALRAFGLERAAGDTWHALALRIPAATP